MNRQQGFWLPILATVITLLAVTSFLMGTMPSPVQARDSKVPLSSSGLPVGSREDIITKAKTWVEAQVPYNQRGWYQEMYREDCSGFVSMAWGLPTSLTTYTLANVANQITKDELQAGDVLNNADGGGNPDLAHVVIFDSWVDSSHNYYNAYEENPYWHGAHYTTNIPYPFWPGYDTSGYVPMRLKVLSGLPLITPAPTQAPNFTPFVGTWYAHSRALTITSDRKGVYKGRVFVWCGPGVSQPCDTQSQMLGMNTTITFTSISADGKSISGTITSGTGTRDANARDAVVPVGSPITATLQPDDKGNYTLLLVSYGWLGCNKNVSTSDPHYAVDCTSGA